MKNTVDSLNRYYDIDVLDVVKLYKKGMSLNEMVDTGVTTNMRLRNILAVLNLRMKKKYRQHDLQIFESKMSEKREDFSSELVDNLTKDVQLLQGELHKNSSTIQKLRDSNNLLRRTIRGEQRENNFNQILLDTITAQFEHVEGSNIEINACTPQEDGTTILVLSDLHYGEATRSEVTNGKNVFNNEVCIDRLKTVVTELCTKSWRTDKLHVYLLGDLLNGVIHSGDLKGELPVMEGVVTFANELSQILNALDKVFDCVDVEVINGNHSRLNDTQKTYQKTYDLEYILFHLMKLQCPQLLMRYSNTGYAVSTVEGHAIGLFHGDTVRGYNGDAGTGAYKVQNIIEKLYDIRVTSLISGHTHKPKIIANQFGGTNLINGSLNGIGEYGLSTGFDTVYPSQTIGRIGTDGRWKELCQVRVD